MPKYKNLCKPLKTWVMPQFEIPPKQHPHRQLFSGLCPVYPIQQTNVRPALTAGFDPQETFLSERASSPCCQKPAV
jgi:hypothetical protein